MKEGICRVEEVEGYQPRGVPVLVARHRASPPPACIWAVQLRGVLRS